jgi:hypothetical protein
MPHMSPADIRKVESEMENDELVVIGAPKHPGRVSINIPQNNDWKAPSLNLAAARAVRHEELRLGRSMTKEEQDAFIKKLCEPR